MYDTAHASGTFSAEHKRVMMIPLTTSRLPRLHTPATHHTPSCPPSSWTTYAIHCLSPLCLVALCVCVSYCVLCCLVLLWFPRWGYALCAVSSTPVSYPFSFLPCLPFCCLLNVLSAFGPRPHSFHGAPLPRHDKKMVSTIKSICCTILFIRLDYLF